MSERKPTISEELSAPKNESALIKKIAVHEAYSAAYKLKLAGILAAKGAVLAGKGAVMAGKGAVIAGKGLAKAVKGVTKAAKEIKANHDKKKIDW